MERPKPEKTYTHLKFPDDLTMTDIRLIIKQCIQQNAIEDDDVRGFAAAYAQAKRMFASGEKFATITADDLLVMILHWAELTDPRNKKGFRRVPAGFANGKFALEPAKISQAMETLCTALAEQLRDGFSTDPDDWGRPPLTPTDYFKEFEEIHPFEDGNGRVGDLLWKIAMQRETGQWPKKLPPKVFK
ncbi:TPA: hypothetical protein DF272_02160 [Candidatus Falkowbacteria bacterium]|nr:hypothetical protein [Candidatus Falkowbacteria bacterium]